jgi:hypothetical protein
LVTLFGNLLSVLQFLQNLVVIREDVLKILQNRNQKNRISDFILLRVHRRDLVLVAIVVIIIAAVIVVAPVAYHRQISIAMRKAASMLILAEPFFEISAFDCFKVTHDLELLRDVLW